MLDSESCIGYIQQIMFLFLSVCKLKTHSDQYRPSSKLPFWRFADGSIVAQDSTLALTALSKKFEM